MATANSGFIFEGKEDPPLGEWCYDWYQEDYYKISNEQNTAEPNEGQYRVMRGLGRNANRFSSPLWYNKVFYGFRCARDES